MSSDKRPLDDDDDEMSRKKAVGAAVDGGTNNNNNNNNDSAACAKVQSLCNEKIPVVLVRFTIYSLVMELCESGEIDDRSLSMLKDRFPETEIEIRYIIDAWLSRWIVCNAITEKVIECLLRNLDKDPAIPRAAVGNNLLVRMLYPGTRSLSDDLAHKIEQYCDNKLRWTTMNDLLTDFRSPRMAGRTLLVGDVDVTQTLRVDIFPFVEAESNFTVFMDTVIRHHIILGHGLGWLKDWCREMKPRRQSIWLVQTIKNHAAKKYDSFYPTDSPLLQTDALDETWLDAAKQVTEFDESDWAVKHWHGELIEFLQGWIAKKRDT
jgi:hypothetical protein